MSRSVRAAARTARRGRDARGRAVADYVAAISRAAGLTTELAWDGDRVVVQ
jgi:hypothetical protein